MIQPHEMKLNLPMKLSGEIVSSTTKVWNILVASRNGNLEEVKHLVNGCPELIYAQYNYTPPIHFAVREGHVDLVKYLLDNGAHDPKYKIYPFSDPLETIAQDRSYNEIVSLLEEYAKDPSKQKYKGDNGEILYNRNELQIEFQKAINHNDQKKTEEMLKLHPEYALDETLSWGEGVMMMPANRKNKKLLDLLISYNAKVPDISKWGRAYYFKNYDIAEFLLEKGMNPNHMSWHHVTLLHDMTQEGNIKKAELLLKYGADINPVEEEYRSTPLGMAARWGQVETVNYLIAKGADINKAGASWATPLAWAKKKRYPEIEKVLIEAGAK